MVFRGFVRGIIGLFRRLEGWSIEPEERVYEARETDQESSTDEIHSVWDYLQFRPNTQAFHLSSVLGFDEWADMNEIRRRIKELFGAEYKNERSLYPYLKTLTDIGLMESSSIGGRMRWRKHDLLVKVEKKEGKKSVIVVEAGIKKSEKNKAENE